MFEHEFLIYSYALALAFVLSIAATALVRRLALRWHFYDLPGERKMHREPMPLMGGVAVIAVFYAVVLGHMLLLSLMSRFGADWLEDRLILFLGEDSKWKLSGILAGGLMIFILGVVDDLIALTPWVKLGGQIAAAIVLVACGNRIELFVLQNFWLSAIVTVFWVVLLINSLNFLDNMDGLCAGVSIIAAFSFFLCLQTGHDQFSRVLLMIFAGAVGGFLYHNLSPARIFMGDAGAMFNGFFLATISIAGTFHVTDENSRVAVAAPLLALAVPLFDTISVVLIRLRHGQPIMRGDKRHFSHRLVELGMEPREAVEFIFLVASVVGLGAALLPLLSLQGTLIILAQTAGVFLLIVILMRAGKKAGEQRK